MFGFPASTEFGKRIPKQKFYENIDITPLLKRVFVEQIRLIYWRNKLAATTLNLAAGETVTEIEVFEVRLNTPQLEEAVLRQMDKEIPYHILFISDLRGQGAGVDRIQGGDCVRQQCVQGEPVLSHRLDTGG